MRRILLGRISLLVCLLLHIAVVMMQGERGKEGDEEDVDQDAVGNSDMDLSTERIAMARLYRLGW